MKQDNEPDLRHLRGDDLAQHMVRLNGHQQPLRFLLFQPYWAPMLILPIPFMGMMPMLKSVALVAALGVLLEIGLWGYYSIRHQSIKAYPGLHTVLRIFIRTYLSPTGRPGSPMGRP